VIRQEEVSSEQKDTKSVPRLQEKKIQKGVVGENLSLSCTLALFIPPFVNLALSWANKKTGGVESKETLSME
jgi:hypothetical protein